MPGSEGAGIADVLLRGRDGKPQHDFKGKLSFSWPRTATQYRNNVGQEGYDPLFAFGFGLTYADKGDLAPLPEASGISGEQGAAGVYLQRGKPAPGFALRLEDAKGQATAVTSVPTALADGSLQVVGVDHLAQEDGRRFTWSGKDAATVELASGAPLDLSRESNGDVMVVLALRPEQVAAQPVTLSVACGAGCKGDVQIRDTLASLKAGEWTTVGVLLKCFGAAGADVGKFQALRLQSSGATTLSVSRVALEAVGTAAHVVKCQ